MDTVLYLISPIVGFVFMLTLIMSFVRMAAGRAVPKHIGQLLIGSFSVLVLILVYVNVV
ncbi:hypothetical protein LCM20_14995 [Halobacillus litoralis]|uniref:hypothetical protein n=1 Tax=Halobacillus litoralis TaxID=45668 RepID=UPI001CD2563C|nr:hypothetical protein [Halobacillus litoralis]MCA0971911.1 hypothetical protein [Halobacillus litoralis]